jgi:hypothetical protein
MNIFSGKSYFNEMLWSLSFYLSIAVLLVFLYLIAAYASVRQCVIIICRCPLNIIEISLSRKMFIEICCKKLGTEEEFSNTRMIIYLRRH